MMSISLDFGASTIDMVKWGKGKIKEIKTFESLDFKKPRIRELLTELKIDLKDIFRIFITGGKSRLFENKIGKIPIIKINEIDAIGRGGWHIWGNPKNQIPNTKFQTPIFNFQSSILVVSMGTGTCMVKVKSQKSKVKSQKLRIECEHIGGTGVGGGTFMGLAREILQITDIKKLIKMFKKGDQRKVDLSVGEITGGGVGMAPADSTASNLGKIVRQIDFSKEDLAAGIANLIGQTIATAAIFAAKAEGIETIVLTGKLTRIRKITEIIFKVGKLYKKRVILPPLADYASAVGAGAFQKN